MHEIKGNKEGILNLGGCSAFRRGKRSGVHLESTQGSTHDTAKYDVSVPDFSAKDYAEFSINYFVVAYTFPPLTVLTSHSTAACLFGV